MKGKKYIGSTKARVHTLDRLFRFFEVDDSLPDPETSKNPVFSRPRHMGPAAMNWLKDAEISECATYEREDFKRSPIAVDPLTGQTLWVWLPCEIDHRMYR